MHSYIWGYTAPVAVLLTKYMFHLISTHPHGTHPPPARLDFRMHANSIYQKDEEKSFSSLALSSWLSELKAQAEGIYSLCTPNPYEVLIQVHIIHIKCIYIHLQLLHRIYNSSALGWAEPSEVHWPRGSEAWQRDVIAAHNKVCLFHVRAS